MSTDGNAPWARASGTSRRTDEARDALAELRPTVIIGLGPTAAKSLVEAQARIRLHLGEIPPFFSFLSIEESAAGGLAFKLTVGEASLEPAATAARASGRDEVVLWTDTAFRRVTEIARNLDHATFHGCPNAYNHSEIVVLASLAELAAPGAQGRVLGVDLLQWALEPVTPFDGTCHRLGLFWTLAVQPASLDERGATAEAVRASLAALRQMNSGAPGSSLQLFDACGFFGEPQAGGLRSFRECDVVSFSAAFLGYTLASSFGREFRRLIEPRGGPVTFSAGLICRYFNPAEVVDALTFRWLREVFDLFDAAAAAPVVPDPALDGLSIAPAALIESVETTQDAAEKARKETERAQRAIETHLRAVLDEPLRGSGPGNYPAPRAPESVFPATGFFVRSADLWGCRLVESEQVHHEWERERDQQLRELEEWKLTKPRTIHETRTEPLTRDWLPLLLLMAVPGYISYLFLSNRPADWIDGALGAVVLALAFFVLRWYFNQPTSRSYAVEYLDAEHARRGAEILRRLNLCIAMLADPENRYELDYDGKEVARERFTDLPWREMPPGGVWGLLVELNRRMHELQRLRHALWIATHGRPEPLEPWFVRNMISRRDLEQFFAVEMLGAQPGADVGNIARIVENTLASLVAQPAQPGEVDFRTALGQTAATLTWLELKARERFARIRELALSDLLEFLGNAHAKGANGPAVFFNSLAESCPVLARDNPARFDAEESFVLFGPPWNPSLARHAEKTLAAFTALHGNIPSEVAMIRIRLGVVG